MPTTNTRRFFWMLTVTALIGCASAVTDYRWDMNADVMTTPAFELLSRRLVVRGMTERQVRRLWGNPRERHTARSYKSMTYWTKEAWITVVFDAGRVVRVEVIDRGDAARTSETK